MKSFKSIAYLLIAAFVATQLFQGHANAAYIVGLTAMVALTPWAQYNPRVFGANTIDSDLQLTEVMGSAMAALKRALLPLLQFSTVFKNVALKGDEKLAVPYYPLATSASATRAANGSRKALASSTATESRTIENFTNKLQAISFTATERARQPVFDPAKHGALKGEKLAYDILADIFSVVAHKNYSGTTLSPMAATAFDENDVGDLRQIVTEEFWPNSGRSLILNPAFGTNLLKQPQIIDASKRGDSASFRTGIIGNVLGFDVVESAGVGLNNGTAVAITAEADDNIVTTVAAAAHGLAVGDRVTFPTLTGGTGLTAATGVYYVLTVPSATTFTVSATLGGATLDITVDATAGTVKKTENIAGMAILPSAILIGFAPVPPTPAIRKDLFDYQELVDDSGLVLQYYHFGDADTDEEVQTIECHYGYGIGDAAQLKIIRVAP